MQTPKDAQDLNGFDELLNVESPPLSLDVKEDLEI